MTQGCGRGRWDPTHPKANPHWARMYAAKRRALDVAVLREAERALAAEEASQRPPMAQETTIEDAMRTEIARAFGRPIAKNHP